MSKKKAPRQPAKDWAALLADMTAQRDELQTQLTRATSENDELRGLRETATEDLAAKSALLTETAREREALRGEHATLLEERDHLFKELKDARAAADDQPTKTGPTATQVILVILAIAALVGIVAYSLYNQTKQAVEALPTASIEATRDTEPTALPTATAGPQSVESAGVWNKVATPHATPTDDSYGDYGGRDKD
jgi:hypothetical protein